MATNNKHKVEELGRIFKDQTLYTPEAKGINFYFEETEETFLGNALGKAMTLYKQTGHPVMADDSGLCVTALNNAPGVYSARYGSEREGVELTASDRNALLLKNMEGIKDRRAYFICTMVLVLNEHRIFTAQETVEGLITTKPEGDNGFGYDPIFFLQEYNRTMAQVDKEIKDKISHRGRACKAINQIIKSL